MSTRLGFSAFLLSGFCFAGCSDQSDPGSDVAAGATSTGATGGTTMTAGSGNPGSGGTTTTDGGGSASMTPGVLANGMLPPQSGDTTAPNCAPDPAVITCDTPGASENLRWIYKAGTDACEQLIDQCTMGQGNSYGNLRDCRRACGSVPDGVAPYCFSDAEGISVSLAEYCVLVAPDFIDCSRGLDRVDEKYTCVPTNADAGTDAEGPLPAGVDARRTDGCGRVMYEFAGPGDPEIRFYDGNNLSGGITEAAAAFGTCNTTRYTAGRVSFYCDPLANYDPASGEPPPEIVVSLCTLIPPPPEEMP